MSQTILTQVGAFTTEDLNAVNANFTDLYAGGGGTSFADPTITGTVAGSATYTAPTLTTPTLGVATATSINKVTITAPATSATLTIANGKTLTCSNTLTFTGTDSSSVAFGAGGTVMYADGVSAGPFTTISSITVVAGKVTALTGS